MHPAPRDSTQQILRDVLARVPAGQRFAQEAFTSDHRRPVLVQLGELRPDTFYLFDELTAGALCDAMVEWAARHGGGRLTVCYSAFGEWRAQRNRLQHLAPRFSSVRVLTVGDPAGHAVNAPPLEVSVTNGGVLSKYRLALREGPRPVLFIGRETTGRGAHASRCLGFFTTDAETVDEVAADVDLAARGLTRRMATFERLQLLHQTTQKVARELESYSRRIELAIRRAQRRPDLLTPARFDRIVRQSIAKIEQLKEIPRRALRTLGRG